MKHRVYISASTQKENIGVGQYGNEQDRMQFLADRISYWLRTQNGLFEVFRNQPGWSLEQSVNDCNNLACEIFIDNHTNAGSLVADGTEVYYHGTSVKGTKLAQCLYDQIALLSPGKDQGVLSDTVLYANGLYVLRETNPPAALIEHIYHTNIAEVEHYITHIDDYAKKTAIGIANYFEEKWIEPICPKCTISSLVETMIQKGLITDREHWTNVLNGTIVANPEFLQILFTRAVVKI